MRDGAPAKPECDLRGEGTPDLGVVTGPVPPDWSQASAEETRLAGFLRHVCLEHGEPEGFVGPLALGCGPPGTDWVQDPEPWEVFAGSGRAWTLTEALHVATMLGLHLTGMVPPRESELERRMLARDDLDSGKW